MKLDDPLDDRQLVRELRLRLLFGLGVVIAIITIGATGYRQLEQCTWVEAFFRTVCVLTTLGLPQHPANAESTMFTIVLAIGGIGSFAYAASIIARTFVSPEFQRAVSRRKVARRMKLLRDHFIVCGYSRIGDFVVRHLRDQHLPCVIIERDDELADRLEGDGQLVVRGDAGHDESLERAGVERARAVIVVTASDAENMLITITARQLAPAVPIVVRCDEETNAEKLMRVGATRVITPNSTGAAQIALAATKPYVIDLIDLATGSGEQEFELRQVLVPAGSAAHGQTLRELAVGSRFGVIVIGIKSQGPGEMQFNPSADSRLTAGDMLITVGREEQFRELERFLGQS